MNKELYELKNKNNSIIFTDYNTVKYNFNNEINEKSIEEFFFEFEQSIKENKINDLIFDGNNNRFSFIYNDEKYFIIISEEEKENIINNRPSNRIKKILSYIDVIKEKKHNNELGLKLVRKHK